MTQEKLQWKLTKSDVRPRALAQRVRSPLRAEVGASDETAAADVVVSDAIIGQPTPPPPPTPQIYRGILAYNISAPNFRILRLITDPIALGRINPKTKTNAKSPTSGTLYAFTRPSDPGYVKIGFTADTLYNRMNTIKCHCGFEPQVECIIEDVPFPIRVEALIHFELQTRGLRRIEEVCRFGNAETMKQEGKKNQKGEDRRACRGGHSEWFELRLSGRDGAENVMRRWVKWMKVGRPYDDQGQLKKCWRKAILGMDKEIELSSKGAGEIICMKMRAMLRTGEIARSTQATNSLVQAGADKKKISNSEKKFREEAFAMLQLNKSFKEDSETRGWFTYVPPKQSTVPQVTDDESDCESPSDDDQAIECPTQ